MRASDVCGRNSAVDVAGGGGKEEEEMEDGAKMEQRAKIKVRFEENWAKRGN